MTEPLRQGEALFSIAEAATACGVGKRTIRRRLDEGTGSEDQERLTPKPSLCEIDRPHLGHTMWRNSEKR